MIEAQSTITIVEVSSFLSRRRFNVFSCLSNISGACPRSGWRQNQQGKESFARIIPLART